METEGYQDKTCLTCIYKERDVLFDTVTCGFTGKYILPTDACDRWADKRPDPKPILAPEDRASLFIEWCALSGFGLGGWPDGAYEQLVSHIRGDRP